jgi:2-polyprenyl-3-methyl-5-hydroxy-6-metoxy-1,4-benzoquinol methylase
MLPESPDFRVRAADLREHLDEPVSRDLLRRYLRDLERVNRWLLGYRPTLNWLEGLARKPNGSPLRILDAGCGCGDGLRQIERWAGKRRIAVRLTGIDVNRDAVAIAKEASPAGCAIEWVCADIFSFASERAVDVVVSSLLTHHFSEPEVVQFIKWMESHAERGWFINDLSRAAIPYHLFRVFSWVTRMHSFVQHDGQVSIARAFVVEDWARMCAAAGLTPRDVLIKGYVPARLCVGRRKV